MNEAVRVEQSSSSGEDGDGRFSRSSYTSEGGGAMD